MENKRPPINLVKNVPIFPQVKCKIILNKRRMLVFVTKDFLGFSTFLYFCIYTLLREYSLNVPMLQPRRWVGARNHFVN